MTVFAQVQINQQSFQSAESFLTQLPLEMRSKVIPPAIRAAGASVAKRAAELAPSSAATGTYKKWSKSLVRQRIGTQQHKDTLAVSSVRKYADQQIIAVYIGPKWPAGNLINVIGHPHQQVLWGRHTGRQIAPVDYLDRAATETIGEQQSAFVGKVQSEVAKILAKGATP